MLTRHSAHYLLATVLSAGFDAYIDQEDELTSGYVVVVNYGPEEYHLGDDYSFEDMMSDIRDTNEYL